MYSYYTRLPDVSRGLSVRPPVFSVYAVYRLQTLAIFFCVFSLTSSQSFVFSSLTNHLSKLTSVAQPGS